MRPPSGRVRRDGRAERGLGKGRAEGLPRPRFGRIGRANSPPPSPLPMPSSPPRPPPCSLYLITPWLSAESAGAFAETFAAILAAAPVASALVRLAPGAAGEAKAIVAPFLKAAAAADCALILENDARLAARLGADGVHVAGVGEALEEALESLKPERIVGVGGLRMRDEAMAAGEMGVVFMMLRQP